MKKNNYVYLLVTLACFGNIFAMDGGAGGGALTGMLKMFGKLAEVTGNVVTEVAKTGVKVTADIMEAKRKAKERTERKITDLELNIQNCEDGKKDIANEKFVTEAYGYNKDYVKVSLEDPWSGPGNIYIHKDDGISELNKRIISDKKKLTRLKKNQAEADKVWDNAKKKAGEVFGDVRREFKAQAAHGRKLKEIKIQEGIRAKGAVKKAKAVTDAWIDFIKKNPWLIVSSVVGGFALSYATYQGIRIGAVQLEKWLGKPPIIKETSRRSILDNLWGAPKIETIALDEVILAPKLKQKLYDFAEDIKYAHEFNGYLTNIMLYGPPGTGKTMYSKALAYYTGLDYAIIPGSSLAKLSTKEALAELWNLLQWARNSEKGCLLIFDEAETFLSDRQTSENGARKLVTEFLAQVEKPIDKKLMFVLVTNRPGDLDKAVVNRMGYKVQVPKPGRPELTQLIDLYSSKSLEQGINFSEDINQYYSEFAQMAADAGVVGRGIETIFKSKVVSAARRSENLTATYDTVKRVFEDHIKEEQDPLNYVF